jgi:hypothetical protein
MEGYTEVAAVTFAASSVLTRSCTSGCAVTRTIRANRLADCCQITNGIAQQDGATPVQVGDGEEAWLTIRQRRMPLLIEYLKVNLVWCQIVAATQLDTFNRASLHLSEAKTTLNRQVALIGT